ncbi:MAG TPA: peptidylprolyl isomerase [Actinomycetota bacterium]|nr:peptidylprolyl isomerase [Actinomycetota bacterium]
MTRAPSRSLVLLVIGAIVLSACVGRPPAAIVDGGEISEAELEHDVRVFRFLSDLSGQPCGFADVGEPVEAACARFTLASLIQEEIVGRFAEDRGLSVPEEDVRATMERLEDALGAEALDELLSGRSLTREDLRGLVERLLMFDVAQRDVADQELGEGELRTAYYDQIMDFTKFHAAHIVVRTRHEAALISRDLTIDNFARNAAHFSIDPASADAGGDLGTVVASTVDPVFVEVALALRPGEISEPVRTRLGWHLIRLFSRQTISFERARERLRAALVPLTFDQWLRDRMDAVEIHVSPRYGRFDAFAGAVLPIRSTATEAVPLPGL